MHRCKKQSIYIVIFSAGMGEGSFYQASYGAFCAHARKNILLQMTWGLTWAHIGPICVQSRAHSPPICDNVGPAIWAHGPFSIVPFGRSWIHDCNPPNPPPLGTNIHIRKLLAHQLELPTPEIDTTRNRAYPPFRSISGLPLDFRSARFPVCGLPETSTDDVLVILKISRAVLWF